MMGWGKTDRPAFVQDYLGRTQKSFSGSTPLNSVRLVSLDTETSGFEVGKDRLLSVAVIEHTLSQIELEHSREWLVYQPGIIANKATEVHGILPSMTMLGVPEKQVLEELIPRLSGAIVIGHYIWFDVRMLNEAFRRNFNVRFCNPTIDVALMAMNELQPFRKTGYVNQRPPSMEDICAHLGIPITERHTAEGDAYMAAEIFMLLCGYIRQRRGKLSIRDLPIKKA